MGELENTLVIYIFGDNGASRKGTITGSFNELTMQNGISPHCRAAALADRAVRRPRRLGHRRVCAPLRLRLGVGREHSVPVGQAGCLPPRRYAERLWWIAGPERINDAGKLRTQFTHCIDIGPTILEAAGIPRAFRS